MKTELKFIKSVFLFCILTLFGLLSKSYAQTNSTSPKTFDQWVKLSDEAPELTKIFQTSATFILDDLLKHQVNQAGSIQIEELKKNILKSVQWRMIIGKKIKVGPLGSRSSAIYNSYSKTVIISYEEWVKTKPSVRPMLALHEALGALGYRDELYQITMALSMMSVVHSLDKLSGEEVKYKVYYLSNHWTSFFSSANIMKKQFTFGPVPKEFADGGVTGVGSGGDEVMIQIKFCLLFLAPEMNNVIGNQTNLFWLVNNILEMQIEPSTQSGEGLNAIQLIGQTEISLVPGHFKIIVPKNSELNNLQNQNSKLYYVLLLNKLMKSLGSFR